MTEEQNGVIIVVLRNYFVGEFGNPIALLAVGFSLGEFRIRACFYVKHLGEEFGVLILELLPRVVFANAVVLFPEIGRRFDFEIWPQFEERFSGL